jgi:hypothetical protein
MNFFYFSGLLLSFVFGSDYEINFDNLVYSFEKLKRLNSREKINSHSPQFTQFYDQFVLFIKHSYQTNPNELFQRIKESRNFELSQIVIETVELVLVMDGIESDFVWYHYSSKNKPIDIFKSSKGLMRAIVRRKDWHEIKDSLKSLLGIQKQFLHLLADDPCHMVQVKGRMREYEFIHDCFDPNDKDSFIDLFNHLSLLAFKRKKGVPKDSSVRKSFKLFRIYTSHYLLYNQKQLGDISSLSPDLVYTIIFKLNYSQFCKFLHRPIKHSLLYFQNLDIFQKIFKIYKERNKSMIIDRNEEFQSSSKFFRFIRETIYSQILIFKLDEKELFLLKAILFLIPIYIN